MSEMTTQQRLILAAAELKQTEVGQKFLAALTPYVDELREACIQAPPEWLSAAQGAARQGSVLLKLINTSTDESKKILAAFEAKRQRST